MSFFSNNITTAENNISKILSLLANDQTCSTASNTQINRTINRNVEKKIDTFEKNEKKLNTLSDFATAFSVIATVCAFFLMGIGFVGGTFLGAALSIASGLSSSLEGGFRIAVSSYQAKIADNNAFINGSMTAEQYVSDRSSDLNTKMRDSLLALAGLTRVFNRLVMKYSQALQKRV